MTNLTEQWKQGELPSGWYWVDYYSVDGAVMLEYIPQHNGFGYEEKELVQAVLAPVPSYDEYISLVNWKEDLTELCTVKERIIEKYENIDTWWKAEYDELKEENTKLKEQLKDCKHIMSIEKDFASCHFEKDKLSKLCEQITEVLGEEK